jgi:hypothetical protein
MAGGFCNRRVNYLHPHEAQMLHGLQSALQHQTSGFVIRIVTVCEASKVTFT